MIIGKVCSGPTQDLEGKMFACLVTYFLQFAWPNLTGYYLPNKQKDQKYENRKWLNKTIPYSSWVGLCPRRLSHLLFGPISIYTTTRNGIENPPNQKLKNSP